MAGKNPCGEGSPFFTRRALCLLPRRPCFHSGLWLPELREDKNALITSYTKEVLSLVSRGYEALAGQLS